MRRSRVAALRAGSLAVTAALTVTLATACSSSATSPTAVSGTSASGTSGAGSVNVGILGAFSGTFASIQGGAPKLLNAWASTVNASGGLAGHSVHIITEDTAVGVEPGLADAKELIDQDHVVAIVDFDTPPDDSTWLPYAKSQDIPVISVGGQSMASPDALTSPNVFPIASPVQLTYYAIMNQAKSYGPKFGTVYCAESPVCAATVTALKSVGSLVGGVSVAADVKASIAAPDFTFACQDLKDTDVDTYYLGMASAADKVADTCYAQGLRAHQILIAGQADPTWATDAAFRGSPVIDEVGPYFANSTPAEKAYRSALTKFASSVIGTTEDNDVSLNAWLSGQLLSAAGAHVTGALTSASLTAGLYALNGETLGGLTQPLTYVRGEPTWLTCYFVWDVGNSGTFVTSHGASPVCAPPSVLASIIKQTAGVTR